MTMIPVEVPGFGVVSVPLDETPRSNRRGEAPRTDGREQQLSALEQQLNALEERIVKALGAIYLQNEMILSKLAERSAGKRAGAERERRAPKLKNIQTREFYVRKVYSDAINGATKYNIVTDGGPKLGTWDDAIGKRSIAAAEHETPLTFTFGENSNGYMDIVGLEQQMPPF